MDLPATDSVEDESDELFSDDEQKKEIRRRASISRDAPVLSRSETPLSLFDNSDTIMPTDAVVPSTPLSLLPFLNKINEPWTSDLETPQAQSRTKPSSAGRTEETPKSEQRTPDVSGVKSVDKIISDSPVIASKASRRRSKRRIFRTSISIDPVTDNEDVIANVLVETPVISDNANSVVQDGTASAAISSSSHESVFNDCERRVLDRKSQDARNKEESENLTNAVPDSLNMSTQEFFGNASFSKIDELCSDTFDNRETAEVNTRRNDEQSVESVDKGRNIGESRSVGFFTAGGASINVSEQALFKAKRLFADAFDMDEAEVHNYESFKRQCRIDSSSFANNVSVDAAKEALSKPEPLTEQLKSYDKIHVGNCKRPIVNKSPSGEVNKAPILFSTASGNPINISKEALLKAKALLADESDDFVDDVSMKCYDRLSVDKNSKSLQNKDLAFSETSDRLVNISEKSPAKAETLCAEQLDTTVKLAFNKTDIPDNKQCDVNTLNIGFHTARGISANLEQVNSKVRTLNAEQLDGTLEPIASKEIDNNDDEIKRQEAKVLKIGFQTARGKPINISEQALSKAKALFAEHLDDLPLEAVVAEETTDHDKEAKELGIKMSNIKFSSTGGAADTSAQTLKAKSFERLDDEPGLLVANKAGKINDKIENTQKIRIPCVGFQTARGTSINISEEALSKAKALFAEHLDDTSLEAVAEETNDKEAKELEIKMSNIEFPSAGGAVDTSERIPKTKSFERLDDEPGLLVANKAGKINDKIENTQKIRIPCVGFQTARGTSINISEEALSKAKALFAEHLDDTSLEAVAEETNDKEAKELEIKMSNIEFPSAGGTVDTSEQIPKTKSFERLDDEPGLLVANKAGKVDDKVENRPEIGTPSIGFQTARGTSINISEQALARAKALFVDQLDCPLEMDIPENNGRDDENMRKRDSAIPHDGLQTAGGQRVPVSNNAALIARELSTNECLDESNPDLGRASLQKRKLSECNVDESTPQGRNRAFETKKARPGEFQARKLFFNNPTVDTDDNDENRDPGKKTRAPPVVDSVLRSTPERDAVESTESNMAESPVIGRKPISRKRKSFGYQRDKYKETPDNVALRENVAQGSAACGKIEDDKLNTKTEEAKDTGTESNEYGDTQVMMDFIDQSTTILQKRLAAALEQEAIITAKRRHAQSGERSRQSPGHLYRYRQTSCKARLSLRKISGGAPPAPRSSQELVDRKISSEILEITAANAATYRFRCSDFYGSDVAHGNVHGIELEDGARLILDENGCAGVWELLRAFLAGPGVDPSLVPARWVENHYRWIVWKLASMDRIRLGSAELPRALTPSHVMAQLKYRYDREIDRSQRPAIRRILEKDDVASKRLILCVSSIVENNDVSTEIGKSPRVGVPKWRIELTDGWYSTNACVDIGMVRNISIGRIREGTKLVVSGAELLNCDQGFYPLEAPADVCLKLHTNSTRRARWDAKLGYAPRSGPIPIRLRNVCPSGGLIGKMTTVVARVYPMLYHEKTASGDSIVRNAKSEERAQSKYEQQCWSTIDAFYAEDFQGKGLSCETNDMAIQLSEDYESLLAEESISKKRHDELLQELREKEEQFRQKIQAKLRESLPGPRQVSQLLKVRVCDENANAILSVWSPSEEVVDALKEGACVSLCNIVASGKRGTELQLTARRSAIFKPGRMRDTSYPARACTSLCEIANSEFAPPYGEFDTVGLVCSVGPAPYGMKDFDAAHLTYRKADSNDPSYLSILFWQGIAGYGYAEILTVGSVVACSNLEWRRATSWNVPAAYCTDRSTFTRSPRRNHLYEPFENLRNLITDPVKYAESCTLQLNVELQKKSTPTRYTAGKNTPIKMYGSTSSADKKLVDYTSPLATPKLEMANRPKFIASNPSIQKRLEKLQCYGEPPELSPITLKKSKRVSLDFRSPVRISDANPTKESASQPRNLNLSNTAEKH